MRVGLLLGLIRRELELVRVELERQLAVVPLDRLLVGRRVDLEDLKRVVQLAGRLGL